MSSAQVTAAARTRDEQQRPRPGRLHGSAPGARERASARRMPEWSDTGEQVRDRAVAGEHRVRVDVVPGGEHERPLVRPRVRQRELRVVAALAGHGDDVDVEGARSPAHHAHPVERRLDLVQPVEQLAGRERGPRQHARRSGSPAAAARRPAPSRRPATRPSPAPPGARRWRPRPLEYVLPVPEVAAEGEHTDRAAAVMGAARLTPRGRRRRPGPRPRSPGPGGPGRTTRPPPRTAR